jgi:hypothetical protein
VAGGRPEFRASPRHPTLFRAGTVGPLCNPS